jgi:hypothetical protein
MGEFVLTKIFNDTVMYKLYSVQYISLGRNFRFFLFVSGPLDNCCIFLDFGLKFAEIFAIENRLPSVHSTSYCRRSRFGKNIGFQIYSAG